VLTAWNRPAYLRQTLESWSQVERIGDYHVILRIDPGNPAVEATAHEFTDRLPLDVRVNEQRLGVLSNPHRALTDGFAEAEFVVYGEEDVLVSDDFLLYMEWAQEHFRDRPAVLAVTGTQRWWEPREWESENTATVHTIFAPTGWGTWRDRWEEVLAPDWQFDYRNRGWDWRINQYQLAVRGHVVVCPSHARSQHIGLEGGVHMQAHEFPGHLCPTWRPHFPRRRWREV
jgi:hypothetical protein